MDIGTPERYLQATWDILERPRRDRARRPPRRRRTARRGGRRVDPPATRRGSGADRARGRRRRRRQGRRPRRSSAAARGRRAGAVSATPSSCTDAGSGRARRSTGSILAPGCEVGEGAEVRPGPCRRGGADRADAKLDRRPRRPEAKPMTDASRRRSERAARRRPRAARPPSRRALAGGVGALEPLEAPAAWSSAGWAARRSAATSPRRRSATGSTRPLTVVRGYELRLAAADRAVLCSSYSGNTEETLACYDAAEALGAQRIVATTGGALAEAARATACR